MTMKPVYYRCGICDHYHRASWDGDCREDGARFFSDQMDEMHGMNGWEEIDMEDIDSWRENALTSIPVSGII